MRVEIWFDFDINSKKAIQNVLDALSTFSHQNQVSLAFRSLPQKPTHHIWHEIVQYGKRQGFTTPLVIDLLDLFLNNVSLKEALKAIHEKYQIDLKALEEVHEKGSFQKVILNHMEHAALKRIEVIPTIQMTHGICIEGLSNVKAIKDGLIKMYETESNTEYCEGDDCVR